MLGNQSNVHSNKPMFRNARLFGPNCTASNNNSNSSSNTNFTNNQQKHKDIIDDEGNMRNDIPEMKLLPMEYVSKAKKPKCPPPPPPPKKIQAAEFPLFKPSQLNKCKCNTSGAASVDNLQIKSPMKVTINAPEKPSEREIQPKKLDKYLVYKRKHSIFGTSKDVANEKLKYVSANDKVSVDSVIQDAHKSKEGKKKYLLFDSKKNNNSKLETIQYYFDNKSYEKYVDTKLCEKLNQISSVHSARSTYNSCDELKESDDDDDNDDDDLDSDIASCNGFQNSRSWEYRDNVKTESKLKRFSESKHQHKSHESLHAKPNMICTKSEGNGSNTTSGASSCSEVSLKRQNCRLKPQQKYTTSKSISDLSIKTNHDVKRINQLFENAKQNQVAIAAALKSNLDNKEKYKIYKKVNDDKNGGNSCTMNGENNGRNSDANDRRICSENGMMMKKYQRSSTELSIKLPAASKLSYGFKNCKLSNCPVSHAPHISSPILASSASSLAIAEPSSSVLMVNERRSKFDENFIKKFEDMRKNANNNCNLRNNEITVNSNNNKAMNISVNGKSNIIVNDTKNHFTPSHYDHDVQIISGDYNSSKNEKEMQHHQQQLKANNNKTTIKINDSCFVVNHTNNCGSNDVKINNNEKNKNIIELTSEKTITTTNWDKNVRVKNNPQPKFNNKIDVNNKIKSEENSVKIYVLGNDSGSNASSPTPSAALSSISSTMHDSSSSCESDKDDGYYDLSSQGRSSSPEFHEMFKKLQDLCNMKKQQQYNNFGCDGTLFWNNTYFDEDETDLMLSAFNGRKTKSNDNKKDANPSAYACTKCHTTKEDLLSNYICICRNKVIRKN
jgi:hypothetical protein